MTSPKSPSRVDVLVGLRVRQARRKNKLTQTDLGHLVGLTHQQIQKYERGMNRISAGTLFEIAKALKVDLNWFVEDAPSYEFVAPIETDSPEFRQSLELLIELRESDKLAHVLAILQMAKSSAQTAASLKAAA